MDVYWKSFPPSDKGNFAVFIHTRCRSGIGKFIFTGALAHGERAHPLEKLLGVKRDLIYL
jgi:hypothetical protein